MTSMQQKSIEYATRTVANMKAIVDLHKTTSSTPPEYPAVDGPVDSHMRAMKARDNEMLQIWQHILSILETNTKEEPQHERS